MVDRSSKQRSILSDTILGSDLGGHRVPASQVISIAIVCQGVQVEEARPNSKSLLFSAMPLLESVKVLVSIIMSVGWS